MKIEKEKQIQTLTLGDKGSRTYLRAPPPTFTARHRRRLAGTGPPLAAGTPGRMCAGSKARRHQWRARRWRAHPTASTRAGEQATAAPPRHSSAAAMAVVLWVAAARMREKGGEGNDLGFPPSAAFCSAGVGGGADGRRI